MLSLKSYQPFTMTQPLFNILQLIVFLKYPTCVGKTEAESRPYPPFEKHPHVRGEDTGLSLVTVPGMETPPRAWGRRGEGERGQNARRNTPTCAGKTHRLIRHGTMPRKHPHVRGEDWTPVAFSEVERETPPRAWGRQQQHLAGVGS